MRVDEQQHSYTPPNGFVPDSATAIRIAEAVLIPVYGDKEVTRQKPLLAELAKGVWTVRGQLGPNVPGGVAMVQISKRDGRILRMSHEK